MFIGEGQLRILSSEVRSSLRPLQQAEGSRPLVFQYCLLPCNPQRLLIYDFCLITAFI